MRDVVSSLRSFDSDHDADEEPPMHLAMRRQALLAALDILDDRIDAAERMGGVPQAMLAEREALIARIEAQDLARDLTRTTDSIRVWHAVQAHDRP